MHSSSVTGYSIELVVTAHIHGNYLVILNKKIYADPVRYVDGNGIQPGKRAAEFMQAEGWVLGIQLQQFQGLFILGYQFGMPFDELFCPLYIAVGKKDFSHG
jgi:hypothetical protein